MHINCSLFLLNRARRGISYHQIYKIFILSFFLQGFNFIAHGVARGVAGSTINVRTTIVIPSLREISPGIEYQMQCVVESF